MRKDFLIHLAAVCFIVISAVNANFSLAYKKRILADEAAIGCHCFNYTGEVDYSQKYAYFEGRRFLIPRYAYDLKPLPVLGTTAEAKWIEVDLSDQTLKAWEGNNLFMETKVSTGLPWTPTPTGLFHIWIKLRATKMEGGQGKYYYYLPNVPYVMYFGNDEVPNWRGYGLHGTYWHNDFGNQHSHGCVNLPTPMAKELYYWTTPTVPEGKNMVYSSDSNPGTLIVIHE